MVREVKVRRFAQRIAKCAGARDSRRLSFRCVRTNRLPLRFRMEQRRSTVFESRRAQTPISSFVSDNQLEAHRLAALASCRSEQSRAAIKRRYSLENLRPTFDAFQMQERPPKLEKRRRTLLPWRRKKPEFFLESSKISKPSSSGSSGNDDLRAYSDGETFDDNDSDSDSFDRNISSE